MVTVPVEVEAYLTLQDRAGMVELSLDGFNVVKEKINNLKIE